MPRNILAGVELPPGIYPTGLLQAAFLNSRLLLESNRSGVFDGPPGTGKTTAAKVVAAHAGRPVFHIQMTHKAAPLEILRLILREFNGVLGTGTKSDMEEELRDLLADWPGLLIIDEIQNLGAAGIQEVRYLHEVSGMHFALLYVGWDAIHTMNKYPDMDSRLLCKVIFEPLVGDELFAAVRGMCTAFEATDVDVLRFINNTIGRGNLREWDQFRCAIASLRVVGPLDVAMSTQIINLLRVNVDLERAS